MPPATPPTRQERNHIRAGNKLYEEKRFAEAEVEYRKALEQNAMSEKAMYNLAVSLLRQAGNADPNNENNPIAEAQSILTDLAKTPAMVLSVSARSTISATWRSTSSSTTRP